MATCESCIHEKLCVMKAFPDAFENTQWEKEPCDHFKPAADVASVILPPSGKTKIRWISEEDPDSCPTVRLPEPGIYEDEIDIPVWGYSKDGHLFAMIDGDMAEVGTQYLYLSREDAERALAEGTWREER